jgi:hypothetical protein
MKKQVQVKHITDQEIIDACNAWRYSARAGVSQQPSIGTPDVTLAHKYPVKVIMAKMQKMVDAGILECGVSLRTAWVKEAKQ